MAGTPIGQGASLLGNILIPKTMQALRTPGLIDQAQRQQQVGDIQGNRLLGSVGQQIGTPQTKSYQVNGRTIGQDNPSTIAPIFSAAKQRALFSQASPDEARSYRLSQLGSQLFPTNPTGKDRYIDTPNGVFDVVTKTIVRGTGKPELPTKGENINGRLVDPYTGKLIADYSEAKAKTPVQIYQETYGPLEAGMTPEIVNGQVTGKQVPIAGTSKDPSVIQGLERKKLEAEAPGAKAALDTTTQFYDNVIKQIDKIIANPDTKDVVGGWEGTFEPSGLISPNNRAALSDIENLQNMLQVQGLQIMRDTSKTGGAVGSVTAPEWPKLSARFGNISRIQDEADFFNNLKSIKTDLQNSRKRIEDVYTKTYSDIIGAPPQSQDEAKVITTPPPVSERVVNKVYNTPSGQMVWTGTGWKPFQQPVA